MFKKKKKKRISFVQSLLWGWVGSEVILREHWMKRFRWWQAAGCQQCSHLLLLPAAEPFVQVQYHTGGYNRGRRGIDLLRPIQEVNRFRDFFILQAVYRDLVRSSRISKLVTCSTSAPLMKTASCPLFLDVLDNLYSDGGFTIRVKVVGRAPCLLMLDLHSAGHLVTCQSTYDWCWMGGCWAHVSK